MQVELEGLFDVETDRAVIAALDDVPGNAGEGKAGAAGHGNVRGSETSGQQKLSVVCPLLFAPADTVMSLEKGRLKFLNPWIPASLE